MKKGLKICGIVIIFLFHFVIGHEIVGLLTERTTEKTPGLHIEPLVLELPENLILPVIDNSNPLFGTVFNSSNTTGDEFISLVVVPGKDGEWLYIDINNDEDLTNDDGPYFFPIVENEFRFFIKSEKDLNQVSGRVLYRVPPYTVNNSEENSRFRNDIIDLEGNLRKEFIEKVPYFPAGYTGRKGTFYFDDRISFSRGYITIGDDAYAVGIYDFDENGLFNDTEDLLFIDIDQDGKLSIFITSEIFKLIDIIRIRDKSYRLSYVDPYGRSIRLVETEETPSNYFISESSSMPSGEITGMLDSTFWELKVENLYGQTVNFNNFKGQYLLLNFWGEWCAPCIKEFPALIVINDELSDLGGQLIGMLLTNDEALAVDVINKHHIRWPQVIISEMLRQRFKINSYPTNLLIFPDGRTFVHANQIDEQFLVNTIGKYE